MNDSLKRIKENIEFIKFQITKGNIFNVEKYLNEIIENINKNKWFFTDQDKNEITKIKQILQNYSTDKQKIHTANLPQEKIKVIPHSSIIKKNFRQNKAKYADYLNNYLLPKYHNKLIKDEKILQKMDKFFKKLSKAKSEYHKLIKKLIKPDNTIDPKINERIESLIPFMDIEEKDLKNAILFFNKQKDKNILIRQLSKRKNYNYYVPLYNIKNVGDKLQLNNNLEMISINEFRKRHNKFVNYDDFVNIMRNSLFQATGFIHVKVSCIGSNTSLKLLKEYYELFIDLIAFFQSELTFKFNDSGDKFIYFGTGRKRISFGFHHTGTIVTEFEVYENTKNDFKVFYFLFKKSLTPIEGKIKNSIKYLRKAKTSIFNEEKLLNYIIALETLTLDKSDWNSNIPKHKLIIQRVKGFIKYYTEFQNLPDNIEKYYRVRHNIVHSGEYDIVIDKDDLRYLERTIWRLIAYLLNFKRNKSLKSAIEKIEKEQKANFEKEKKRLTDLGIKLNKEYVLNGKLYQNSNILCRVKAKLCFKDYSETMVIDTIVTDLDLIQKPSSFHGQGTDKFYLEGSFSKFILEKTEVNLSIMDLFPNGIQGVTIEGTQITRLINFVNIKKKNEHSKPQQI